MALFSDWGSASEYEDIDAAQVQLEAWMATAVSENAWPAEAAQAIVEGGDQVLSSLEGWFGVDLGTASEYWGQVAASAGDWVEEEGFNPDDLTNWDAWQAAFDSAAGTATSNEEAREEGSLATVAEGTLAATVEDLGPAASIAGQVALGAALGAATVGLATFFLVDKKQAVMGAWTGAAIGGAFQAWRTWPATEG